MLQNSVKWKTKLSFPAVGGSIWLGMSSLVTGITIQFVNEETYSSVQCNKNIATSAKER